MMFFFNLYRIASIAFILLIAQFSQAQIFVDTSKSASYIVNSFVSIEGDVNIDKIHYSGNKNSIGLFRSNCQDFPLNKGIILSTGDVWDINGPNNKGNCGANHHNNGDPDLETLANGKTFDAASLEFEFIANSDSISFEYVFASEEYPEYVNKGVNDVFAFFISDSKQSKPINIAQCNNKPITVNNINSSSNSTSFIANRRFDLSSRDCLPYSLQSDGLTVKLTTSLRLTAYKKYNFKICITDVGDGYFDSAVMLNANTFASVGSIDFTKIEDDIKTSLKNRFSYFYSDSTNIMFIPDITFDFDSFNLPDSSQSALSNLINVLSTYYDFNIDVIGYSDSIGSVDYNKTLSLKRAKTVSDYLIKQNIEESRINALGLGDINPLANNNQAIGRSQNRRVAFKLYKTNRTTR